jgi:hypothetical protein
MLLGGLLIATSLGFVTPASAKFEKGLSDDKFFPSLLSSSADAPVMKRTADSLYEIIGLASYGLERDVFFSAFKGLQYFQNKGLLRKSNLLTICDYSQSSNNKRLYVIDVLNGRMLFNTYVSHGKNSGEEFAGDFSNLNNSNKSSLGFMITAETYTGKAGLSMRFNGMEKGINDNVRRRDIVLHGSRFVNEDVMSMRGMIGKSLGCPAVPYGIHTRIIDVIKGGSTFFIYHPDQVYARNSPVLNTRFDMTPVAEPTLAQQEEVDPILPAVTKK